MHINSDFRPEIAARNCGFCSIASVGARIYGFVSSDAHAASGRKQLFAACLRCDRRGRRAQLKQIMRPRKRDFRGDTRKGAKNYDTVSSDDSEVYRRKDPFAGRNRKRPSGRRAQLNICNPSLRFGKHPFECI